MDDLSTLKARLLDQGPAAEHSVDSPGPPEVPILAMPFDHNSTDGQVAAVLTGRDVTWTNRCNSRIHTATVSTVRFISRRGGHDDYVDFISPEGYRAVYLNQIMGVG